MSCTIFTKEDAGELVIHICGRFNCEVHDQFRSAYENKLENRHSILIDLAETEYIDSSALGMLLHLRSQLNVSGLPLKIRNASPSILNVLELNNFQRLFAVMTND